MPAFLETTLTDLDLSRIRPHAVARAWGEDSWQTLRVFLQATRAGLFDLRWEVLCPNCRSSRQPLTTSLSSVSRQSHCEVCQIRFDADFAKSVELTFVAHRAVRRTSQETYCLTGPGGRPHVVAQMRLEPGEKRQLRYSWDKVARYQMRSPQVQTPLELEPKVWEVASASLLRATAERFEVRTAPNSDGITIENAGAHPIVAMLERRSWDPDILTAARVTNWQEFRDLFATEVVSPSEEISVGAQVILFTDLRGSMSMYNGRGDAPAYVLVRNHFRVLVQVIQEHHGGIVKTIGDAVMGVFSQVDEALAAVWAMHRRLPEGNPALAPEERLRLKSSLHVGPCLAVNANDKLDFFGTTVNLAARMIGCSQGDDLVISDEIFQRPEAAEFLRQSGGRAEAIEMKFRGFEQAHTVWRITFH